MNFTREELKHAMLLYAVTDRSWLNGRTLEQDVETVLQNGATFLQLREKTLNEADFLDQARKLKPLAQRFHVPFIINDSIEIALACDADGVHVGQSDLQGRDVRALLGPDKILGISANTVETARAAQAAGADYIGVGAVFGTTTKKDAKTLSVPKLREIRDAVDIPVVAIGGISADNIAQLSGSGVDGVAVVSTLFAAQDIAAATRDMLARAKAMVAAHG
jgi:thiamine-phosphate pyrophosphorylase